jgi:hypothetical protein
MKIERVGIDEYWTVESWRDLGDWIVVGRELWKDGTREFRLMYCTESVLAEYDFAMRLRNGPSLTAEDLKQSR